MGIRCDQMIGLSPRAEAFLDEHCSTQLVETFVDGIKEGEYHKRKLCKGKHTIVSMFGDESILPGYELKDGSKVYEDVQAEPWSSGPCFFLYLVDEAGKVVENTAWTDEEIDKNL